MPPFALGDPAAGLFRLGDILENTENRGRPPMLVELAGSLGGRYPLGAVGAGQSQPALIALACRRRTLDQPRQHHVVIGVKGSGGVDRRGIHRFRRITEDAIDLVGPGDFPIGEIKPPLADARHILGQFQQFQLL